MYHAVFAWNIGLLIHGNDYRLAKIKLGHRGIERGNFALARFLTCHIHTYLNQAVSCMSSASPATKSTSWLLFLSLISRRQTEPGRTAGVLLLSALNTAVSSL